MYTIQVGQLVLNLEILIYLLCGAFNAVLLWLLV